MRGTVNYADGYQAFRPVVDHVYSWPMYNQRSDCSQAKMYPQKFGEVFRVGITNMDKCAIHEITQLYRRQARGLHLSRWARTMPVRRWNNIMSELEKGK